ncbi:MAG: ABC transporter ATP-binding protein [Bacteroidia bacterium]
MAFLDIQSVSKSYRNHRALIDVSMQVPKGGVMGLLGPNGAGKTTLIRMINRIIAPDSGSLWLDGAILGPEHARRIGYLPEERGLYKKMKIGEQLLYLARLRGLSSNQALEAAKHWMSRLEMQSWWNKKAEELSKGMQQKVQLVAALMHDPDLLILDEPFSGFDPVNARLLKNILLERRAAGTTLLISTHRMETVEDLCTHVVLIHRAGVVLSGETEAVRRQFSHNRIEIHCAGATASPPPAPLPAPLQTSSLVSPFLSSSSPNTSTETDPITRLVFEAEPHQWPALIDYYNQNSRIVHFSEKLPSFQDIFINAVGSDNLSDPNMLNGDPNMLNSDPNILNGVPNAFIGNPNANTTQPIA